MDDPADEVHAQQELPQRRGRRQVESRVLHDRELGVRHSLRPVLVGAEDGVRPGAPVVGDDHAAQFAGTLAASLRVVHAPLPPLRRAGRDPGADQARRRVHLLDLRPGLGGRHEPGPQSGGAAPGVLDRGVRPLDGDVVALAGQAVPEPAVDGRLGRIQELEAGAAEEAPVNNGGPNQVAELVGGVNPAAPQGAAK